MAATASTMLALGTEAPDFALKDVTTGKARWLLSLLTAQIGDRPIAEIEPYELLAALKKIEATGRLETTRRTRTNGLTSEWSRRARSRTDRVGGARAAHSQTLSGARTGSHG